MNRINILGSDTKFGFRTFELYEGDISQLNRKVDVLVISAFSRNYVPFPGTVIWALKNNNNLNVSELAEFPAWDFRSTLDIWISKKFVGRCIDGFYVQN